MEHVPPEKVLREELKTTAAFVSSMTCFRKVIQRGTNSSLEKTGCTTPSISRKITLAVIVSTSPSRHSLSGDAIRYPEEKKRKESRGRTEKNLNLLLLPHHTLSTKEKLTLSQRLQQLLTFQQSAHVLHPNTEPGFNTTLPTLPVSSVSQIGTWIYDTHHPPSTAVTVSFAAARNSY